MFSIYIPEISEKKTNSEEKTKNANNSQIVLDLPIKRNTEGKEDPEKFVKALQAWENRNDSADADYFYYRSTRGFFDAHLG
jgi:hypothetical protein